MPIIVQKYGGTSVDGVDRLRVVADRVVRAREAGNDVIVVVSAMGQTTDDLARMAKDIAPDPDPREMDMLLTAGERIAMALLGIAINERGCRAASYTGSQAGIITDTAHGQAKIIEIRPKRILEALEAGNVVIIAGFQGLSSAYEITTLGRGGSDLTAVAMAAAVGAEVCEIYTDVGGVMTADPRVVPEARLIERIGYDDMLELAAAGAKVLQSRSVELARRNGLRLHVRSSFDDEAPGTWVQEVDDADGRRPDLGGRARDRRGQGDVRRRARQARASPPMLFKAVASAGVSVDMIVQNVSHEGCHRPVVHRADRRRREPRSRDRRDRASRWARGTGRSTTASRRSRSSGPG